ncbi:MAG: hypothetical protein KJ587_02020 [Alphaproteobacteria bacterium]|nr:hypothetical protein [Alphaproteobacteria bacterium]
MSHSANEPKSDHTDPQPILANVIAAQAGTQSSLFNPRDHHIPIDSLSRRTPASPPPRSLVTTFTTLALAAALSAIAARAEPASDILPIWREVFARPDTSHGAIPAPATNPLTPAKIALGKKLFFDTRLSGDNTRSCATCHDPKRAFTDGRSRAAARDGKTQLPNTPPLRNLAWAKRFFWDGRADSLEQAARFPIEHPQELAGSWSVITAALSVDPAVRAGFERAFPDDPVASAANIAAALASYERTLITRPSRFDKFVAGDTKTLTATEQSGFALFVGKAGCVTCHNGWRFTDDRLHRTGRTPEAVKTPTLRDLKLTAPYMHDGSVPTLSGVIAHYQNLKLENLAVSPSLVRPLNLTDNEKAALIAFLESIDW